MSDRYLPKKDKAMSNNTHLAAVIKACRAELGLTAKQLGQLIGVPHRTIEGVEQGREFRYPALLMVALDAIKPDEITRP